MGSVRLGLLVNELKPKLYPPPPPKKKKTLKPKDLQPRTGAAIRHWLPHDFGRRSHRSLQQRRRHTGAERAGCQIQTAIVIGFRVLGFGVVGF